MSGTWQFLLSLIIPVLANLLQALSPAIKIELNSFMTQLYLKAMATPNAWDDMAIGFLLDIMAIPRPPPSS